MGDWPNAARDRGTIACRHDPAVCVARPALGFTRADAISGRRKIVGNLLTRARNWREVEPWYPDQTRYPKTSESRAIEAVMNALVLATATRSPVSSAKTRGLPSCGGHPDEDGPETGAWTWLNFKMER